MGFPYGTGLYGANYYGFAYVQMTANFPLVLTFGADLNVGKGINPTASMNIPLGFSGVANVSYVISGNMSLPVSLSGSFVQNKTLTAMMSLSLSFSSDEYIGSLWIPDPSGEEIWSESAQSTNPWQPISDPSRPWVN